MAFAAFAVVIAAAPVLAQTEGPEGPRPHRPLLAALREKLIKRFDADGDGALSEEERAAARETLKQRGAEWREKILDRFDADGDAQLSDEEKADAREAIKERVTGKLAERREAFITKWDTDGDGRLGGNAGCLDGGVNRRLRAGLSRAGGGDGRINRRLRVRRCGGRGRATTRYGGDDEQGDDKGKDGIFLHRLLLLLDVSSNCTTARAGSQLVSLTHTSSRKL